jgi:hypothetical protein
MGPRCGNRSRTGLSGRSGADNAGDLRHSRWRFRFRDARLPVSGEAEAGSASARLGAGFLRRPPTWCGLAHWLSGSCGGLVLFPHDVAGRRHWLRRRVIDHRRRGRALSLAAGRMTGATASLPRKGP